MKNIFILIIFSFPFFLHTSEFFIKKEPIGRKTAMSVYDATNSDKKLGTLIFEEKETFIIDSIQIYEEDNRKKGLGSLLLKKFLTIAYLENKSTRLTASPLTKEIQELGSTQAALERIIKFYTKNRGIVESIGTESADIVFPPIII